LKTFEDKALSAQDRALAREKVLYEKLLDDLAPSLPHCNAWLRRWPSWTRWPRSPNAP